MGLVSEKDFTLPDSKLPKNAPAYALDKLIKWDEMRAYPDIPNEGQVSDEYARKLKHGYYACVSYIDALVGKVLKELDTLKLRDNTIVVLWSDHGWKLGEYGAWCKHTNYELDTRIPLIISIPGKKSDVNYSLVETVDLAPTLAEYCGIEVKEHWEGNSLKEFSKTHRLLGKMLYSVSTWVILMVKRPWDTVFAPKSGAILNGFLKTKLLDVNYTIIAKDNQKK